jgi:hypothetical protein
MVLFFYKRTPHIWHGNTLSDEEIYGGLFHSPEGR